MDLKVIKGKDPRLDGVASNLNNVVHEAIAKYEKHKLEVISESLEKHFNIVPTPENLKRVLRVRDSVDPFKESYYLDICVATDNKPLAPELHPELMTELSPDKLVARFIYQWSSLTDPLPKLLGWSPIKDSKFMATESPLGPGEQGKTPDPK